MPVRTRRFAVPALLACCGLLASLAHAFGADGPQAVRVQALPPYIEALAPDTGPVGTKVVITGLNFTGASLVVFNEARAANFQVVSDTEIWASVPPGAISGPVSVETPAGTTRSQAPFQVPIP